ncbi:hypothetical protein E2C01_081930 [Portunus trituberculatus]|uniref:Uncharacterized protein n=1 Tax=Portunus trituberculatus TaxID=210409 RepID=A0A5B7IR27_PORTR|nr:hypothetical protein [Portunus trituberculatus]
MKGHMNQSNKRTRGKHKQRNTLRVLYSPLPPPFFYLSSTPPSLPFVLRSLVAAEMREGKGRGDHSENAPSLRGKTTPRQDLSPAGGSSLRARHSTAAGPRVPPARKNGTTLHFPTRQDAK